MKKLWTAAAGVAAIGMLVAGCSDPGGGEPGNATTGAGAWPAQSANLSGTTLTIWAAQNSVQARG